MLSNKAGVHVVVVNLFCLFLRGEGRFTFTVTTGLVADSFCACVERLQAYTMELEAELNYLKEENERLRAARRYRVGKQFSSKNFQLCYS
jgi:hypothetical protein